MTKLRIYFVTFFLLLAIPLGLLLRRTYSGLEQESFFFYRKAAESVLFNVGEALLRSLQTEEARPYTQYRYVHVADHPVPEQAGLNLSPLAAFPVQSEIPAILGYFQIDPDGSFHTPLLPDARQHPGLTVPRRPERESLHSRLASLIANDRPGFPLETDAAADDVLDEAARYRCRSSGTPRRCRKPLPRKLGFSTLSSMMSCRRREKSKRTGWKKRMQSRASSRRPSDRGRQAATSPPRPPWKFFRACPMRERKSTLFKPD